MPVAGSHAWTTSGCNFEMGVFKLILPAPVKAVGPRRLFPFSTDLVRNRICALIEEEVDRRVRQAAGDHLEAGSGASSVTSFFGTDFARAASMAAGTTCGPGGVAGAWAGGVGVGGSWAEVSTVAKAKSAGVAARASRMVLPRSATGCGRGRGLCRRLWQGL